MKKYLLFVASYVVVAGPVLLIWMYKVFGRNYYVALNKSFAIELEVNGTTLLIGVAAYGVALMVGLTRNYSSSIAASQKRDGLTVSVGSVIGIAISLAVYGYLRSLFVLHS